MVQTHLVQVGYTQKLTLGLAGVHDGTQQVEYGGELQGLADRAYELHGAGEQLSMQIYDSGLVKAAVQAVDIAGELDAVMLDHVAGTAH